MQIVIREEGQEESTPFLAKIELEEKSFKSGSKGFYYRGRVKIGEENYYCQIIISRKEE